MQTGSIFPQQPRPGTAPGALVEFRAGKLVLQSNQVTPDKRKGLISLTQEPSTGLIHLLWKDRTNNQVEDDFIIFPDDARWEKVTQTSGRVFCLDFKASNRKLFFWMQEVKADKDEEYMAKINQYINNPPAPGSHDRGSAFPGLDPNLLSMFSGARGAQSTSATAAAAAAVPAAPAAPVATAPAQHPVLAPPVPQTAAVPPAQPAAPTPIQITDLQSILQSLGVPPPPASAHGAAPSQPPAEGPSLGDVLNPEAILPALESDEHVRQLLLQHLPAEQRTPAELAEVLRSPQFRQTLDSITSVLHSRHAFGLLASLGLNPAHVGRGVEGFLAAVQEQAAATRPSQSAPEPMHTEDAGKAPAAASTEPMQTDDASKAAAPPSAGPEPATPTEPAKPPTESEDKMDSS